MFFVIQVFAVAFTAIVPTSYWWDAPIIENSCPAIFAAEAFGISGFLAELLPGINKEWAFRHGSAYNKRRERFYGIAEKLLWCNALLIVILKEI